MMDSQTPSSHRIMASPMEPRRQIAVLIDFENCSLSNEVLPIHFVQSLRERGRLVVKKAFADWSRVDSETIEALIQSSIELEALSSYRSNGKNAADIRLVVEAMELAFRNPVIDTFVIVSGDSDYVPLVVKLRKLGKYVIIVADELQASRALVGYCDEIIPIERLQRSAEADALADDDQFSLLRRCLASLVDREVIDAGVLKSMLLQLDSSFHENTYGYRKFGDYLRAAETEGVVRLTLNDNGNLSVGEATRE